MTADTILVDRVPGETRVAALAGGRLVDLHVARGDPRWAVGAIHLGRVAQVVAAFAGAFVDIGLEQAAFLRLADVPQPPQPGDPLIVQIVRATAGEKGLGVTARPRLAGQLMDWTSGRPGLRMPRGGAVTPPGLAAGEGADLRPAAVAADPEALAAEAAALRAQWQRIEAQAARGVAPAPLAPAPEPWMPLALHHAATLTAIRFADRASAAAARAAVAGRLPEIAGLLAQDAAGWRLFDEAGVEEQIAAALMRRVKLPRGGALTIDEAEAATLIDVDAEESRAAPPALNRAAV
ncbi:MAG: ribonuclease E/G, partial [Alphaproteobacteria bacterium]